MALRPVGQISFVADTVEDLLAAVPLIVASPLVDLVDSDEDLLTLTVEVREQEA